jgi:hypothetical protein
VRHSCPPRGTALVPHAGNPGGRDAAARARTRRPGGVRVAAHASAARDRAATADGRSRHSTHVSNEHAHARTWAMSTPASTMPPGLSRRSMTRPDKAAPPSCRRCCCCMSCSASATCCGAVAEKVISCAFVCSSRQGQQGSGRVSACSSRAEAAPLHLLCVAVRASPGLRKSGGGRVCTAP